MLHQTATYQIPRGAFDTISPRWEIGLKFHSFCHLYRLEFLLLHFCGVNNRGSHGIV